MCGSPFYSLWMSQPTILFLSFGFLNCSFYPLGWLNQAMDRAHRLGQKRVVNVHRLIMRGTLEEKIMSLQRFKISVANTVINAENASLNTMDTTQLLDLFTVSGNAGKVRYLVSCLWCLALFVQLFISGGCTLLFNFHNEDVCELVVSWNLHQFRCNPCKSHDGFSTEIGCS